MVVALVSWMTVAVAEAATVPQPSNATKYVTGATTHDCGGDADHECQHCTQYDGNKCVTEETCALWINFNICL